MELIKLNEVYNLIDNAENGWKTQGQVIRDANGDMKINFYTNNDEEYVGSYNYDVFETNNDVRISTACVKGLENEFTDYCKTLLNEVLKNIK
jgi:hypothetical protein